MFVIERRADEIKSIDQIAQLDRRGLRGVVGHWPVSCLQDQFADHSDARKGCRSSENPRLAGQHGYELLNARTVQSPISSTALSKTLHSSSSRLREKLRTDRHKLRINNAK